MSKKKTIIVNETACLPADQLEAIPVHQNPKRNDALLVSCYATIANPNTIMTEKVRAFKVSLRCRGKHVPSNNIISNIVTHIRVRRAVMVLRLRGRIYKLQNRAEELRRELQ